MWVLTTHGQYLNISDARKIIADGLAIHAIYPDGHRETIAVIPDGPQSLLILKRCLEILQMQLHSGKGFNDFVEAVKTPPVSAHEFVSRKPRPHQLEAAD